MLSCFGCFNFFLIFGMWTCLCDEDDDQQKVLVDSIPELYLRYRKALDSSGEKTVVFRRVLRNNKQYNIHLNKLRDVNGFKKHNLIVKEESDDNPLIYVNNPVETSIPNAYLSLEGFKELLTGRVLRQRNEFQPQHYKTLATSKPEQRSTVKRNKTAHFTKFKEKFTKLKPRKISKMKKARKKITATTMMITASVTNAHANSKIKLATKTTISTSVIEDTSQKASTVITTSMPNKNNSTEYILPTVKLLDSISNSTKQIDTRYTTENAANDSANVSPTTKNTLKVHATLHHILHKNSKESIKDTVTENSSKSVTNGAITAENTLKTDAVSYHNLGTNSNEDYEDTDTEPGARIVTNVSNIAESTLKADAAFHDILYTNSKEYIEKTETKDIVKSIKHVSTTEESTLKSDGVLQHSLDTNSMGYIEKEVIEKIGTDYNISNDSTVSSNTDVITETESLNNITPTTVGLTFEVKNNSESTFMESTTEKLARSLLKLEKPTTEKTILGKTVSADFVTEAFNTTTSDSSVETITENTTTEDIITQESNNEEYTTTNSTTEESSTEDATTKKRKLAKSTPRRQATVQYTPEIITFITTKRPTTTPTTTKKATKRTTIGRPLVFMGGWENS